MGRESDGFGTQDLEANTEFRHSAFSHAVSAVRPFEVREGMEGEHTPETDLTRGGALGGVQNLRRQYC